MRGKLLVIVSVYAVLSGPVRGADLHVPGSFPTIQAAVNASSSGDWILVAPGVYAGDGNRDIDPSGKSIRIIGTSGASATILDCEGTPAEPHRGFLFTSGDASLIIDGLTIRNGYGQFGGGIYILGGAPAIRHVIVENCSAEIGGGVLVVSGEGASLNACTVRNNSADSGGGLEVRGGTAAIEDCLIAGNIAASFGGGVRVQPGRASVRRCTISSNTANLGAGVWCDGADATFTDCTISGNNAQDGGGAWVTGDGWFIGCRITGNTAVSESGGLRFQGESQAAGAEDCWISENMSGGKGAVTISGNATPVIANCDIIGNTTTRWGGAGVHCEHGSEPHITGCRISGNTSTYSSGGLYSVYGSNPRIEACLFDGNLSRTNGGGVELEGGQAWMSDCVIRNNVAEGETGGLRMTYGNQSVIGDCLIQGNLSRHFGAVTIRFDSTANMFRCVIAENVNIGYGGGGVHCENSGSGIIYSSIVRSNLSAHVGGVMSVIDSNVQMVNGLVADNHSQWSGAIEVDHGAILSIVNSTVSQNVHPYNGAITQFDGELLIGNSIVWGNGAAELVVFGGATSVVYSDVEGGWTGAGNIDADPRFRNAGGGDYSPMSGSPCIDAADNRMVPEDSLDLDGDGDFAEPIPFDLGGLRRFMDDPMTVDTGSGAPPLVDMGAHEFEPGCEGKPGDWDGDCDVDLSDHALFAGCLSGPDSFPSQGCELMDMDGDGDVDLADVSVFQTLFGR